MNKIITKLNEIEEKASAILADARERNDVMMAQLQIDEKEIDAKFDRLLMEKKRYLTEKLQAEAKERIAVDRARTNRAIEELDQYFQAEKEQLAEAIFTRVIQVL